jgi:hypothetical protein
LGTHAGAAYCAANTTCAYAKDTSGDTCVNIFLDGIWTINRQTCLIALQHLLADFIQGFRRAANCCARQGASKQFSSGANEDTCTG